MPRPHQKGRHQKAVLWLYAGDDEHGEPTVGEPAELNVRWTAGRGQMTDDRGNVIDLDADVKVDRDVPIGSQMWLGELSEWLGTGSAGDDDEIMRVVKSSAVKDVKGRVTAYRVGLKRFRGNPSR